MQIQRTTRVPQGFVFNHKVRTRTRVSCKGRGAAEVAPVLCAPAFLTTPIESIRPTDKDAADRFGINLEKSYANVLACCKRFLKFIDVEFDFHPTAGISKDQNLGELIEYFEKKIEPFGLSLVISKKDSRERMVDVLQCVVYRYGAELEDVIIIFYCAPAMYMSPAGSQIYKRFMKFVSSSTNISLGMNGYSENFYLDCIINMYDDVDFYRDDGYYEREENPVHKKYKEDGEFWNLFDEINSLPDEKPESLYKALEEYRQECPDDELELIETMMDGIDIIKDANYYWFEFNPDNDGIENEDGYDSYASSVFASAILFSEYDGISEELLDYVNNEVNAGIMMTGWNIHQWLSPRTKKADVLDFMRCKDLVARLDKWTRKFYQTSTKFDLYGKSEQDTE